MDLWKNVDVLKTTEGKQKEVCFMNKCRCIINKIWWDIFNGNLFKIVMFSLMKICMKLYFNTFLVTLTNLHALHAANVFMLRGYLTSIGNSTTRWSSDGLMSPQWHFYTYVTTCSQSALNPHYSDIITGMMVSQITSFTNIYPTV